MFGIMKKLKIIFSILGFYVCFLGCRLATDGFCLSHIQPLSEQFCKSATQKQQQDPHHLQMILNQPFYYLGKGAQTYVFGSRDGEYVIKFFRFERRRPFVPDWVPIPSLFAHYRDQTKHKRLQRLQKEYRSYQLAFDRFKDESGLIYLHFDVSTLENQKLTIYDKIGIKQELSLQKYPFILQKRALGFYPTLSRLIESRDIKTAQSAIDQLIDLIVKRHKLGLFDKDPDLKTNFGFIGNRPIQIDTGRFTDAALKESELSVDVRRICGPLAKWLHEKSVDLEEYLNRKIQESLTSHAPSY